MKGNKLSILEQTNSGLRKQIEYNRQKLKPIISSILFCATHDLSLRGKTSTSGIFNDLLLFRIESGDELLQKHISENAGNAKYTSPRIQNEIISICGKLIKNDIVNLANAANAFSVIADETADISGTEQLSIGIRFLDKHSNPPKIREEFLGFTPLEKLNAQSVATNIISFMTDCGLNLNKLYGQGYDGCATMAGQEGGVSKLIRDKYNKALFFHCSNHRLNLVINDLNKIMIIRNTTGTIKDIIRFFRESTLRRKLIPNTTIL
ncbi:52 kDa repressor of the inhibitor of the protein kinase-like [Rhopalosiphum padi]|uniref:52 kDa repressor of the inhibitor of the protein kinase-like n=1 Tax=Rhopalosiphum padi TaxID=40932 RepID=UPI00298DBF61|nr:52 kDa repressor of the inhibitor of the protein kinase-like [Rhopalosiphum padi]